MVRKLKKASNKNDSEEKKRTSLTPNPSTLLGQGSRQDRKKPPIFKKKK